MRKKLLSYTLVASLIASTALSGCGNKETTTEAVTSTNSTSEASTEATTTDATSTTNDATAFNYEAAEGDGIKLTSYTGSAENLIVPSEIDGKKVTEIGESCFAGSLTLKKVELPEGITKIGDYAFECCSYLKKVYLPDSLLSIGAGAFSGCVELTLVDIQNNLQTIGDGAFLFCKSLVTLEVPDTLTDIGEFAFGWCQKFTTIDLQNTKLTKISDRTFYQCDHIIDIHLPSEVTTLGKRAFSRCDAIKEINIPESVTEIDSYAFESCASLESIIINCEVFNGNVFSGCSSLSSIDLSDNVKKICENAYTNTSVETIRIPATVTEIEPGILNDSSVTEINLDEESSFVIVNGDLYSADKSTLLGDVAPLAQGSTSNEDENESGDSTSSTEEATDSTETTEASVDTSSIPSLDEVLAKYPDFSSYTLLPNDQFDAWAEEYVKFNSDIVVPDLYHNIYITLYKGETFPHFIAMTAILNKDESAVNKALDSFGDDYAKMYTMMDHGLATEMRRFRMQRDLLLFTGVYDSQLQTAAGTDHLPSLDELKACIGNTFTDSTLTSTTTDPAVATTFGSTMFIIYAKKENLDKLGCVCMDAYMHSNENEILLSSGATYKILDVGNTTVKVIDENDQEKTVVEGYVLLELLPN